MGHTAKKRGERRNGGGRQRVRLLEGAFGFLLHVGASPLSAFTRTCTPHPRYRPKRDYHRSGTVACGGLEGTLSRLEGSRELESTEARQTLDGLSFQELWSRAGDRRD
ncbi:MAG: hypothetical protein GF403_02330 [Candidatus Coatesbacteria bacterium]|nr:hypothetical protein [Candidatus Coatesbacteria bacterium]